MIWYDPTYAVGSFKGFHTAATNYTTWFLESSAGPIIDDCPVSRGRMLGGIAHAWQASKAQLKLHVETLQAQVGDLESAVVAKYGYCNNPRKSASQIYAIPQKD